MADSPVRMLVKIGDPTTSANEAAVNASGELTVIEADAAAIKTAVELIDNPVFADDDPFTLASSSVMISGAIRDDTLGALTAVEGDAVPIRVNSTGALHVTGGGGGTEYTQDEIHTDPATAATLLLPRDDVLSTQETADGDWTLPRANARGAQWVEIDLTNALTVDTEMAAAAAAADNFANPTTAPVLSFGMLWDGATWDRMKGDSADGVLVNLGSNNDVSFTPSTLSGEVAVRATSADVAVDATLDVDEADAGGTTSFCVGFDASASVPIKAELQSVVDGVGTAKVTLFAQAGEPIHWRAPHRDYFEIAFSAEAGFDGWRVVITNKDSTDAADLYGTIYTENA